MIIRLNNKTYEVEEGSTLTSLLTELAIKPLGIAIAINYKVIPKEVWPETFLSDNMDIMLIQAVSGG